LTGYSPFHEPEFTAGFFTSPTKTVMANIDMVIDNLEDFQSSVVSHSKLIREKYVTAVQPRFYHDGRYEKETGI
jgi:hypothetical protein